MATHFETSDGKAMLQTFISTYKELPELWDVRSDIYMKKDKKNAAYELLLSVFKSVKPDATVNDVKRKLNTLKSNFRRDLKKIQDSKRSASAAEDVYVPSSWVFHELLFLKDLEKPVKTKSTMKSEVEDQENYTRKSESAPDAAADTPRESVFSFKSPVHVTHNKRKHDDGDPQKERLWKKVETFLDTEEDELDIFGKFVAARLRKLSSLQQVFAEKQIMEILYNCSINTFAASSSSKFPLLNDNQEETNGQINSAATSAASGQEENSP